MKAWLKRIGSKAAMEKRQEERRLGKINRPLRVWGIAKCAKWLREEGLVEIRYKSDPTLPL